MIQEISLHRGTTVRAIVKRARFYHNSKSLTFSIAEFFSLKNTEKYYSEIVVTTDPLSWGFGTVKLSVPYRKKKKLLQ